MHDDLIDGVDWAVKNGIAQADKVAIYGGSYGGYATLWGVTNHARSLCLRLWPSWPLEPNTLLASIPPYWESFKEQMFRRVGDPRTDEGKALLKERSPLTYVQNISKPLLIGQGANDPRVKQAEADQIVAAMQAEEDPRDVCPLSRRGPRFCASGEPHFVLCRLGGVPVAVPGWALRGGGRRLQRIEHPGPQGADFVPGLKAALATTSK